MQRFGPDWWVGTLRQTALKVFEIHVHTFSQTTLAPRIPQINGAGRRIEQLSFRTSPRRWTLASDRTESRVRLTEFAPSFLLQAKAEVPWNLEQIRDRSSYRTVSGSVDLKSLNSTVSPHRHEPSINQRIRGTQNPDRPRVSAID